MADEHEVAEVRGPHHAPQALVRYFGSKTRLAPHIVELMPKHRVYVEPYCGSAAVLFAKQPVAHEILNDRNRDIVAFFTALRDEPDELERVCRLTPYSRDEYVAADLFVDDIDPLERARRFWVRSSQSMSGVVEKRTTWSGSSASGSSRAKTTGRKVDMFTAAAERLAGCIIDNRDAIEVIRVYGMRADAVIYADPPYLKATRKGPGGYQLDAEDEQHHRDLAAVLHETPAVVILSGYASPLYEELYDGWAQVSVPVLERAGQQRTKSERVEVLWVNRDTRTACEHGFAGSFAVETCASQPSKGEVNNPMRPGDFHPAVARTFRYIAEMCSHTSDDGGEVEWDEHLHDPGVGGHVACGPCAAFRALDGIHVV